jgi:hypothetical protein
MTATLLPDFSISLQQRRWACVLDPMLALSEYGLPLAKQLGELMELWVVREFWHILDDGEYFKQQPEVLLDNFLEHRTSRFSQQILRSLQEWDRLRTMTDRNSWNVHFLADVIGESCVPSGTDPDLIWRWESLAQSLDAYLNPKENFLNLAVRDLAALAAVRPACILTYRLSEETMTNVPPSICNRLEQWGIRCHEVGDQDAIAHLEREQFRNLLVHAGLSKLLWAGLNLVIIHLVVPAAAALTATPEWAEDFTFSSMTDLGKAQEIQVNLWEGAQGFWYPI